MIRIASIIERFESDYLSQYGASILPSHARALGAMKRCRSTLAPRMLVRVRRGGARKMNQQGRGAHLGRTHGIGDRDGIGRGGEAQGRGRRIRGRCAVE